MKPCAGNPAMSVLRYSRAYTLTIEALHTLCCTPGAMRDRLAQIDPEFFVLSPDVFPEGEEVRDNFVKLYGLATRYEPRSDGEGRISATLARSHHSKLKEMLQLVWDLHRGFSQYMNSEA